MKTLSSIIIVIIGCLLMMPYTLEENEKSIKFKEETQYRQIFYEPIDTTNLVKKIQMVEDNLDYLENNIRYGKNKR